MLIELQVYCIQEEKNPLLYSVFNTKTDFCPCHLWNFVFSFSRVVIILEMDVLKTAGEVEGKIGDPTPYMDGKTQHRCLLSNSNRSVNMSADCQVVNSWVVCEI